MTEKLTKVEVRWQWLAGRIWPGSRGWSPLSGCVTKADRAMVQRRVNAGHVEVDEYGMYRLTDAGRTALAKSEGRS